MVVVNDAGTMDSPEAAQPSPQGISIQPDTKNGQGDDSWARCIPQPPRTFVNPDIVAGVFHDFSCPETHSNFQLICTTP